MTTKWSDPAVCFNGKRPAEIPEGAVVQKWNGVGWYSPETSVPWASTTPKYPIFYRYELPPVETEPFAVVFGKHNCFEGCFRPSDDGENWMSHAKGFASRNNFFTRFYDKHGQLCEPEALEEAGG